jgi:hypothetical protein
MKKNPGCGVRANRCRLKSPEITAAHTSKLQLYNFLMMHKSMVFNDPTALFTRQTQLSYMYKQ